jgi:glyoxylase-like metal-dependent hydrolase (beta-lactamase superfamily II)
MTMNVADSWFKRQQMNDGITWIFEPHIHHFLRCNVWHVPGRERDMIVDTSLGIVSLRDAARDLLQKPVIAAASHSHFDHMGGHHEFDERLIHSAEAAAMAEAGREMTLRVAAYSGAAEAVEAGYTMPENGEFLSALPCEGFDPGGHMIEPAEPTWLVEDGDMVDLGDRVFEVLHFPGHSPGSIGLWEAATGTLFSGDAIYDGPLLEDVIDDYIATMERLRALPVTVVHGGHEPSFGRQRMIEICDSYLAKWNANPL